MDDRVGKENFLPKGGYTKEKRIEKVYRNEIKPI